jgi:hypothetical protein
VAVEVATQPTFAVGTQRVLFGVREYAENESHPQYDVGPDGRRFVFLKQSGDEVERVIVLNWFVELRERVGTASVGRRTVAPHATRRLQEPPGSSGVAS